MTPAELKSARHALGLSAEGFARWVGVESGRTVRRWESGERDIPGPVQVLVRAAIESTAVRRYFGIVGHVSVPSAKQKSV
jgi:DNA-binding transcriptional regulator YiaG